MMLKLLCCNVTVFSLIISYEFIGIFFSFSSGTEICLSISESIDVLVSEINHFFQKVCSTAL